MDALRAQTDVKCSSHFQTARLLDTSFDSLSKRFVQCWRKTAFHPDWALTGAEDSVTKSRLPAEEVLRSTDAGNLWQR